MYYLFCKYHAISWHCVSEIVWSCLQLVLSTYKIHNFISINCVNWFYGIYIYIYIYVLKDNSDSRGSSENLGGEGDASDEEEVGGYNSGGDGAYSHAGKTGGDNIGGDDAYSGHAGKVGGDNTSDEEKVGGDNTGGVGADNSGGDGASDEEKVGADVGGDNSGGDGAFNDEEEVGGHSRRDAFDFEENEEPWGAFI